MTPKGHFEINLPLIFDSYLHFRAVAGQENPGDLRSSVNNLLEAMQNLLGGLHLPEVPQDASSEGASEDDDVAWQ